MPTTTEVIVVGDVVRLRSNKDRLGAERTNESIPRELVERYGIVRQEGNTSTPYRVEFDNYRAAWVADLERLGHQPRVGDAVVVKEWESQRDFLHVGSQYTVEGTSNTDLSYGRIRVTVPGWGTYYAKKWGRPGESEPTHPAGPVSTPAVASGQWIYLRSNRTAHGTDVYVNEHCLNQAGLVREFDRNSALPARADFLGTDGSVHTQNVGDYEVIPTINTMEETLSPGDNVTLVAPHTFGGSEHTNEAGIGSKGRVTEINGSYANVTWESHPSGVRPPGSGSAVDRTCLAKTEYVVPSAPQHAHVKAVEFLDGAADEYKQARWGQNGLVTEVGNRGSQSHILWDNTGLRAPDSHIVKSVLILHFPDLSAASELTPTSVPEEASWANLIEAAKNDIHAEASSRAWCSEYEEGFQTMFGIDVESRREVEWMVSVELSNELDITNYVRAEDVFGDEALHESLNVVEGDYVQFTTTVSVTVTTSSEDESPTEDAIESALEEYSFDSFEVQSSEVM